MTELPERPLDLTRLLDTLAAHGVEYAVIGGVAVQVHGHRRTTRDLDVIPSPRPENLRRLAAALAELDARPRDLPGGAPDADQLAAAAVVPPLTTRHGQPHILNAVPGAAPYNQLRARALVLDLGGLEIAIVGLDDLISMKRAACDRRTSRISPCSRRFLRGDGAAGDGRKRRGPGASRALGQRVGRSPEPATDRRRYPSGARRSRA